MTLPRSLVLSFFSCLLCAGPSPLLAAPAPTAADGAMSRAAPALVVVVAIRGEEETLGTGIVISSDGVVLTSKRLADRGDEVYVFLPGGRPGFPDEDLTKYTRSQLDRGLRARPLQGDAPSDLMLLGLPPRNEEYGAVALASDAATRRQDVVLVGAPQVGRFAAVPGLVGTLGKSGLELDTRGSVSGAGPLLDQKGRLLGYVSSWRSGAALARPLALIQRLLAQANKARPAVAAGAQAPAAAPGDPNIDSVLKALGETFGKKLGRYQATRLYCEFLAARGLEGKAAVYGAGEIETINAVLGQQIKAAGGAADGLIGQIGRYLPALLVGSDGHLWHRDGRRYALDFPALAWDVDDVRGTLYATTTARELMVYEKGGGGRFQSTGLQKVRDVQASNGTLYYVTMDGALMQRSKTGTSRLLPRAVTPDSILASQGVLYMTEAGQLYRHGKGQWDRGGEPIHRGVRQVVAQGAAWYALDPAGRVYSGGENRIIEGENPMTGIWLIGKNVLALTRKGKVMGYTAASGRWQTLRE